MRRIGPRAGLDGCAKSRPHTGIRPPDRPARTQSHYRISYPGSRGSYVKTEISNNFGAKRISPVQFRIAVYLTVPVHIRCYTRYTECTKTYVTNSSWFSPPLIKQNSSYQHGSKSEQVPRYPLLCRNPRNAVINKKHATLSNA